MVVCFQSMQYGKAKKSENQRERNRDRYVVIPHDQNMDNRNQGITTNFNQETLSNSNKKIKLDIWETKSNNISDSATELYLKQTDSEDNANSG